MGFVLTKLVLPIRWTINLRGNQRSKEDPRKYLIQRLALLEAGERDDYQAALALERGESLPSPTEAQLEMSKVSFAELLGKFLVADTVTERPRSEAEASGPDSTVSCKKQKPARRVECAVCWDTCESIACLNGLCGHFICPQCVVSMAEVANRNEDVFPLQCCKQQLPVDTLLSFLHGSLRTTFSSKCAEAATPSNLRVYCSNKTCSNFIGRAPATTPCVMSCPECKTNTCSRCKHRAHPRESCDDSESREVRKLAKANGWKTCPRCKMIVERSAGCAHMFCRCRKEFCYECGEKWGQCVCRRM